LVPAANAGGQRDIIPKRSTVVTKRAVAGEIIARLILAMD
jgi:hypothetical protein